MMEDYYSVREPGSYGGVNALRRLMRAKGERVTQKQTTDWLAEQEAYNLHKPVRRRFVRRKIFSRGIDYLWQADLADMTHLAEHNDSFRYLLTVIDVFSKYAFVATLKKKDSKSVVEAFAKILEEEKRKTAQAANGQGQRVRQRTVPSDARRTAHTVLRQSKRRHQSQRRRTIQSHAENQDVEILHASQHFQVRRRFARYGPFVQSHSSQNDRQSADRRECRKRRPSLRTNVRRPIATTSGQTQTRSRSESANKQNSSNFRQRLLA